MPSSVTPTSTSSTSRLCRIITASDPDLRNRCIDDVCEPLSAEELLAEAAALESLRRESGNLYERVRSLFFLYAIHRFHLPTRLAATAALIPYDGFEHLLNRRFDEAIETFLEQQRTAGPSDALSSGLASAYHDLALQTLANQVRRSVRSLAGNQWMFRMGHPTDHPLRIRPELLTRHTDAAAGDLFPLLHETTPVRMDLSHAGWSDIFFLGMDYPEAARVLNISVDLAVHGRDTAPKPPVEAILRVIDEPVLRLTSVDLAATAEITDVAEVFDFARDYLGLLKAAVIAGGIVPSGLEGSGASMQSVLERLVGHGLGLEVVSSVNNIPKGSRLAVSTNLLAALIAVCMRATGQAASLTGPLDEAERRLVAARAILGEWLGGSGGGWQDSGGVWPAAKLIRGVAAVAGDPEHGVSRGRLLPVHEPVPLGGSLEAALVLVHGGMAQNVGPILEMVTEKYLLRSSDAWEARQEAGQILDEIIAAVQAGDVPRIAAATTRNFFGPVQTIIPWATNQFTETVIARVRERFGEKFLGFWMLGGMSGGGMGFIVTPDAKPAALEALGEIMASTKRELEHALPFAMEPVVYDFAINQHGTRCELLSGPVALMPPGYYALTVPALLKADRRGLSRARRGELDACAAACRTQPELSGMVDTLFDRLFPRSTGTGTNRGLRQLLDDLGFDATQHEQIRSDLIHSRIGLAQNRLPPSTKIEDVLDSDVTWLVEPRRVGTVAAEVGQRALAAGEVAVVTLAAGVGSRWTQGAGVVKALNPFCKLGGAHRSFLEVHLAKSQQAARKAGIPIPHVITTSHLTHDHIAEALARLPADRDVLRVLSPGRAVGLRLIPTARDLRFAWEELAHQTLDEQKQKVRDSLHGALLEWATTAGEGSDYTDNLPQQCLHPVGHWFEIPNMLRNGVLASLLGERPQLKWLFLHNIDTLGADLHPALLGEHIVGGSCLSLEVIPRRIEDRGGGLARVNGRPRLVEGLAMPSEADEFRLRYYNSLSTWIDIDQLLAFFRLTRADLVDQRRVTDAIREGASRVPTYVTLKDVKKRWGHGQEDVFPVTQFEKLWGDMTSLPEVSSRFFVVSRFRGQQLKDVAQLDGWLRDGSADYVATLCGWR
ncbi:MAG: UTP--glucose-1-phosphate uridylyltransferase [Pirellulales bacterium]